MNLLRKIGIGFFLTYFFLYLFPFPLNHVPFGIGGYISDWVASFWESITPIFAKNIIGYQGELSFSGRGSGDTTYDYLLALLRFLIAFFLALVFSFIRAGHFNSRRLFLLFLVILRYYLAYMMFVYGFSKIFYLQFPELSLINMTRTYGESSPMGLMWKFMGYSETYSIFTGLLELVGGLFLLSRYTKVLGGLLVFGIMFNVFMLNMSYDVPVKLFSFHLCLISLFILIPDFKSITDFFLLNRNTTSRPIRSYFENKYHNYIGYGLKFMFIFYITFNLIASQLKTQKVHGKRVPESPLYGIYHIDSYQINKRVLPPLVTDTIRWRKLIVDKKTSLIIRMDGERMAMKHVIDTQKKTLELTPFLKKYPSYNFHYTEKDSVFLLNGISKADTLVIISKAKYGRDSFFLEKRGFNWINEYPVQR